MWRKSLERQVLEMRQSQNYLKENIDQEYSVPASDRDLDQGTHLLSSNLGNAASKANFLILALQLECMGKICFSLPDDSGKYAYHVEFGGQFDKLGK